jgi:hypothetical protein
MDKCRNTPWCATHSSIIPGERSSLSPGKGLHHHQRSSRHAMVPLSDTSPTQKGEKPAPEEIL